MRGGGLAAAVVHHLLAQGRIFVVQSLSLGVDHSKVPRQGLMPGHEIAKRFLEALHVDQCALP